MVSKRRFHAAAALMLLMAPGRLFTQSLVKPTLVYMVRHGETETGAAAGNLSEKGRARAADLAAALKEVRFTHILASHTTRARQMAEPVAQASGLKVMQLPEPGSLLNGRTVVDATPSGAAARPLADAIRRVPQGSTVLMAGNRENIFAVLNDLGVPLCGAAPAGNPADNCVPCRDASCWGTWFDRIWVVALLPGQPVRMIQIHYGTPRD